MAVKPGDQLGANPYDIGRLLHDLKPPRGEFRVPVRRPDDLLVVELAFANLQLAPDAPPRLVRQNANAQATLIVVFPPQSFGEQAFLQTAPEIESTLPPEGIGKEVSEEYPKKNVKTPSGATQPPSTLPVSFVRMAGQSRLAFAMPSGQDHLDYTLVGVLEAMRTWPLRLSINAGPDVAPPPTGQFEVATIAHVLGDVRTAARWAGVRNDLTTDLESHAAGISGALAASAARVSERLAAGLAGSGGECDASVLQQSFFDEFERLAAGFDALRQGPVRAAAQAALSLHATELLVSEVGRHGVSASVDLLGRLPITPFLMAPHQPPRNVTALELPYRVYFSPIEDARFTHLVDPVERQGRTELWHTRMTTGDDDIGRDAPGKGRAIWTPDYDVQDFNPLVDPPFPFRMSLDALDRKMLVDLMAGYTLYDGVTGKRFYPRASMVERLHLSSLGALLDTEGNWERRPDGVDLEQWRHLASLGRDGYVRVVYAGRLCPFGHSCTLIKVTERKFQRLTSSSSNRIAVLRQRFYLVVRERVRSYNGSNHRGGDDQAPPAKDYKGRNFPFKRVEILTRVTPDLLAPESSPLEAVSPDVIFETVSIDNEDSPIVPRMAFWPSLPGSGSNQVPFRFDVAVTGLSGERVTYSVPLLFVGETANRAKHAQVRRAYNAAGAAKYRRAELGGQVVTYAPYDPGADGDPRLPTAHMTFAAGLVKTISKVEPNFYPETAAANVGIRPLQKLLGRPDAMVDVTYPEVYKQHGFTAAQNAGELFLVRMGGESRLEFGEGKAKSDALGGLATPQMAIQGLSRLIGPVGAQPPADPSDPAQVEAALETNVTQGKFDPASFFEDATILGGINIADIIINVAQTLLGLDVPKLVSLELPDRVEARFTWDTEITQSDPLKLFVPQADGSSPTRLRMEGLTTTPLGGVEPPSFRADAELNNFKIDLFGFVILWFVRLGFRAETGQKPDVLVQLAPGDDAVRFGGPLEFVAKLAEILPSNGFSDPPALEVTPNGIGASFYLNLPTVSVGVLTIANMSIGAGFQLPFDATPVSVRFAFSRRESPFTLTVWIFGGGGFFAIGISTRGVNEIEAALEFGAGVAIDLGVASGSVEVKAGIYFHWLEPVPDKGSVTLAGYVRIHGHLSVLAIISVSLTFNLQLAYHKDHGTKTSVVWGEATLVVEIDVLFFSASVSVHCRREFGGSESDPKFIDLMPNQQLWSEYCGAFALEEAA